MRRTLGFFLNFSRLLMFLILGFISNINLGSNFPLPLSLLDSDNTSSLKTIDLDGYFSFHDVQTAATDFGNHYHFLPSAVLHPKSSSDISKTVRHVYELGPTSKLTIAARGHAHSVQGQAQAPGGVVIDMESLRGVEVHVSDGKFPYIDVSGGELWINILHESLKHGLAPKSWTDYLYLTVGGTLSNAGISGQTFRHGPQISNVYQLEVITGRGDRVICSMRQNADLFFGVLGGLGQFGIITRARIALEPAPQRVKWIRVLYSDFSLFIKDQEMLISSQNTFDYIEGFVIINRTGLLNNWRSSFSPRDMLKASQFNSEGRTLYCLEMTKNFNPEEIETVNQELENLISQLSFIPSMLFSSEVSYLEFLNRVQVSEKKLRSKGLWEVPHPWLNLLIPRTKIHQFARKVFGKILTDSSSGPILIYPVNKSKWDNRTSAVIPDGDVFYLVAFLSSASTFSSGADSLEQLLAQNKRILDLCENAGIGMKQYLPHYTVQEDWKAHFGPRWETLVQRKAAYDPLAILAPVETISEAMSLRLCRHHGS